MTKRENCCNCIAISLYWTSDDLLGLLRKYLYTIQRTIKNVKRCLPDWIVRLYIDSSVYQYLKTNKLEEPISKILDYFFVAENTEVYT